MSVQTTNLRAGGGRVDGLSGVEHEVLELQGLDEVRVPDHAPVGQLEILFLGGQRGDKEKKNTHKGFGTQGLP